MREIAGSVVAVGGVGCPAVSLGVRGLSWTSPSVLKSPTMSEDVRGLVTMSGACWQRSGWSGLKVSGWDFVVCNMVLVLGYTQKYTISPQ